MGNYAILSQNRVIPRKCHFAPECQRHLLPKSRFSPCPRTRKCHSIPELEIAISRMSFLLSLHFREFEIVQNGILRQNVIFPKMAFCLRMSFCARIGKCHSVPEPAISGKCHFAPESEILYLSV